jgi:ectoine hydroxylase-related dioxygenase (phytanoyl-CoA dioxygenase family)
MGAEELRSELSEHGFARLGHTVGAELLALLDRICAELVAAQTRERSAAVRSLGSLISVFSRPELGALIADPALLARLEAVGLGDLRFSAGYVLSKEPRGPRTFWHQDWGFWQDPISYQPEPVQACLLFYLIDVDPSRGGPRLLPGTHRRRHPLHETLRTTDVAALRRIDDPAAAPFAALPGEVSPSLKRGEVLLLDPRILHATHDNRSDQQRTAIALWYFVDYSRLDPSIRAFAAAEDPIAAWPPEARSRVERWMPTYLGDVPKAELQKHPDHRLC